ncbi:hypothetical protein Microterr_00370 [Microbacterium terricola]|uniref:Uncharacterized protein n=1 Tax=Microbacterium terricola TaxID=344163 RepID=A0ABM8DUZ7_9MICO|nr:hypothetical protein Microterr_00370 [Microbacterium terricola]
MSLVWVESGTETKLETAALTDGTFRQDITIPADATLGDGVVRVVAEGLTREVTVEVTAR